MSDATKVDQSTPTQALEALASILRDLSTRKTRENISSVYANGVNFELGDLDIKILFGQISRFGTPTVEWHTGVTMHWAEAKLLSYYLRINLAIYEAQHGDIKIPASLFPPSPVAPADLETNPKGKEVFETVQTMHEKLVAELGEPIP